MCCVLFIAKKKSSPEVLVSVDPRKASWQLDKFNKKIKNKKERKRTKKGPQNT